jgi:hypothetical protein
MKKLIIISLALVLALGATGVGYAHWSQTLTINEVVETGSFCIEFTGPAYMVDTYAPPDGDVLQGPPDWNADPGFLNVAQTDKNVGWGEIELTDPVDSHYTGIRVTLHDVYPGYYNHAYYVIHNCGTIPAWLPKIIIKDCAGEVVGEITADGQKKTLDLDGNGTADFQILYGNHIGRNFQYNPCERIDISFEMLVLQDNDPDWQNNTFCFSLELPFVQYNYTP